MAHTISNDDDIIDSRDIIERIDDLEATKQSYVDAVEKAQGSYDFRSYDFHDSEDAKKTPQWTYLVEAKKELADWLEGKEAQELETLKALAEQGETKSSDWTYGETLIHRRYWVDYVQDLLADCGDIPRNLPHYVEIDWEATAGNIEVDYASIDFDGVEYLIRSC